MNVKRLEVENVKRIKAVAVTPDGSVITVGGKNAQGKSSILDSIMMALVGKKSYNKRPIRDGEEEATIKMVVGDYTIERTIRKGKPDKLKIYNDDGMSPSGPQGFLDDLCGKLGLAFDPVAFAGYKPEKQLEILKGVVGLDFHTEDDQIASLYDERTDVNRTVKVLEGQMKAAEYYPDAPDKEVSVEALMKEQETALETHRAVEDCERDIADMRLTLSDFDAFAETCNSEIAGHHKMIEELKAQIKCTEKLIFEANKELEKNAENKKKHVELVKKKAKELEALQKKVIEVGPINAKISESGETNRRVRANQSYKRIESQLEGEKKKSKFLTDEMDKIKASKQEKLKEANFPVDGLSFDDDGVLYNGVPFEQASQAERIKVSMAIAFSLNPKLKVALIREGSLLDEDNLKLIAEIAEKYEAQVWLEKVASSADGCQLYIEDGEQVV